MPDAAQRTGTVCALPVRPRWTERRQQTEVTPWSVIPGEYGDFLIAVYEEWVRHDVGKVFVMNFEWALNAWIGNPSPVCVHAKQCGRSVVMEHNGDVYACDHCVYPEYRLGNIVTTIRCRTWSRSHCRSGFGVIKETALPRWCRECEVLAACRGGCPKHRFARTSSDEPGLHYLCEGYRKFFLHIRKYLRAIAQLLENGLPRLACHGGGERAAGHKTGANSMNEHDRIAGVDIPPPSAVLRMIEGFWLSRALSVAVKLGIADLLKDGPKSSKELADATGTHEPSLFRVLRALAGAGVFAEDESGRFGATPLGAALQTGAPGSLRAFVLEQLDEEHYAAWGDIIHSVKTGETAFDHHFNMDLWQYRALHPEDAKTFDEAMANMTEAAVGPILGAYDFSSFHTVVDVGGGDGSLLAAILEKYPGVKGVLFDMPRVIPKAQRRIEAAGLTKRCEIVSGDFFKSVPPGGDAYILKAVIHDWDDERAATILRNCLRAMAENGRLLLIEAVIPPGNEPFFHKFMDLNMMVMTGGRERTEAEYRALLHVCGLQIDADHPDSFRVERDRSCAPMTAGFSGISSKGK